MPLAIEQNVDLTLLNTLGISAQAEYLVRITSPDQLAETVAFAAKKNRPLLPWGSGSNVVIGQASIPAVVLKIEIKGRTVNAAETHSDVTVGAGENWDEFVSWSVEQNLHGVESLSLIPGTVGAAPNQNVGAYGQEVSETITQVEAFDLAADKLVILSNTDCRFGYRDSFFKHEGKKRYIITGVTFRLAPATKAPPPTYESLKAELARQNIVHPSVADIRSAVIAIRRSKLPDPAIVPTAGSFFHNPVIPAEALQELQKSYPTIPHWPVDGQVKIAGGWLVEQCGFKGMLENGVGVFEKQALALINPGHRPAAEVLAFRDRIVAAVQAKFGVTLQMEPELITM